MQYDYLIVGSGISGAVFAHEAAKRGKRCLVIEKRNHTGGNVYLENVEGILVHKYGPHIFHTHDAAIFSYVQQFVTLNHFINSPIANYKGEVYNLPFNMNTFAKLWGIATPKEARQIIEKQKSAIAGPPKNLEEQAISLVGEDIYEKLIKGYTEKQWGRSTKDLPAFIIKRLPVRFTYDNNYFDDPYQGIPHEGYNHMIDKMLSAADVRLGEDYLKNRAAYRGIAKKVVYTGRIDAYFDDCFEALSYRSLRFDTRILDEENYQGVAVMNFTDRETPYTRVIEHKHFAFGKQPKTVVTKEYPMEYEAGMEPYYPVNDEKNTACYQKYHALAQKETGVIFLGRLAQYQYYDMDDAIAAALLKVKEEFLD